MCWQTPPLLAQLKYILVALNQDEIDAEDGVQIESPIGYYVKS
jgi:hypothetical protein